MSIDDHIQVFVPGHGWVPKSKLQGRIQSVKRAKTTYSEAKPLKSKAMAIHPTQVEEFNTGAPAGVYYDEKGDCHFSSRRGRNAEMRRRGTMDMDGSYGDHCGR